MSGETVQVERRDLEQIAAVLEEASAYHHARAEAERAESMQPEVVLSSLAVELDAQADRARRILASVTPDLDGLPVFGIDLLSAEFVGQLMDRKDWQRVRLYGGNRAVQMRARRLADDVTGPLSGRVEATERQPADDGIRTFLQPEQWLATAV